MQNIWAIFKKELKLYFNSPIAYIVITVFLMITGWFFSSTLFIVNEANLRSVFGAIPMIFIFVVPAITMRLVAEEKRSGTIELLMTMPVKDWEVILAKYGASLVLLVVSVLLTLAYLITISALGDVDPGPIIGGYLGLILMGGVFLAIGLFASSLTKNQVVAYIISFIIIFILVMLDKILVFVPDFLVSLFEYLSIDFHFNNIARGVIDSRDVIYYLSVIVLALYLASWSLESRKWK
ncbi:ABC transporter permease [candidate division KSB1 bacterium]|nr:ABC transporter permease [candidate division KSB1 bacterium]